MEKTHQQEVIIPLDKIKVKGNLALPEKAKAMVIFAHGSGSSRLSPRNQMVANFLVQRNFGTLLFDLLTPEEDLDYSNRFNISLLSNRLVEATEWLEELPEAKGCRLGYFGASTGAASALLAAAALPEIAAVVSRGGRPDLAWEVLGSLQVPTLLIVGSMDTEVIQLNQKAYNHLQCGKQLEVVEGASHLFEEKGTMEKVCLLAASWFEKYLQPVTMLE